MNNSKILNAVDSARKKFDIEDFPGNLFLRFEEDKYLINNNLILFKEDIDRLSGFIGYGENGLAAICINYKRSIGHQNFTLAHELGHWIMHKGKNISDGDIDTWNKRDKVELEANEFAKELLYPEKNILEDFNKAKEEELFLTDNREQLANYVNILSHQYTTSFELVLRCLLYKNHQIKELHKVKKEIEKALGCNISSAFDKDFYVPNEDRPEYQRYTKPYIRLRDSVNKLVEEKKIGRATGESINLRNGEL